MRALLVACALFAFALPLEAQTVTYQTITDNSSGPGASAVAAGNFASDGGNDVATVDSNGNINCVASDGGKYDQPAVVSQVQFPVPDTSITSATLKTGATDYLIVTSGAQGLVNIYTSSACAFTFAQSLITPLTPYTPALTPAPSGGAFLTIPISIVDGDNVTFPTQVFQNNNGTFEAGPAGLGAGEEVFAAGSAIGLANPVVPQPPGAYSTASTSLWTYANGAWSNTTPVVAAGPVPMGVVVATNTKALYLISRGTDDVYIQLVNADGSLGTAAQFPTAHESVESLVVFGGDSIAINQGTSVIILQDSTGNGVWAQLGNPISVPIPNSGGNVRVFIDGAPTTTGFVFQSQDGTATVFTVGDGPMIVVPSSISFESTAEGSSSTQALTLTNSGNQPLTVSGATFSGTNASDFSQTNACSGIAPSGTCTMSVVFSPTTANTETATMVINSNAVNSPSVALYAPPAPAPSLSTSGTSLDYGSVAVNSSATMTLVLGNSGTAPLTNISIAESGAGFSITAPCATSLAVLAQCSVAVKFAPTATGGASGTLTITSNAPTVTITLSGTATPAPAVSAQPPALTASGGGTVTAQISFSNFPSTPTLTASCQIPDGSCAIQNNSELVVTTTARTSAAKRNAFVAWPRDGGGPWRATLALLAIGLVCALIPRKRRIAAVAFTALALLAACSGGNSTPPPANGTPAGTYNVVVTGVAGSVSQSVTVPVTVN